MKLSQVERYATGTAPYLGVPVFDLSIGKVTTAVFRREHLKAAVESSKQHGASVSYDSKFHTLVFNGCKGSHWELKDLRHNILFYPMLIRNQLQAWAMLKQKTAINRALPENERKIAKLRFEIGKLERKRDKICATPPHNPMIPTKYDLQMASASERAQWHNWLAEKPQRWALGRLVRRERKTWAQFYRDVEFITGRTVQPAQRHERFISRQRSHGWRYHRRQGSPNDLVDYLTYIYKHIGMAEKPYGAEEPKWYEKRWGKDEQENDFQHHRSAQYEYLEALHKRQELQTLIDGHLQSIRELESPELCQT